MLIGKFGDNGGGGGGIIYNATDAFCTIARRWMETTIQFGCHVGTTYLRVRVEKVKVELTQSSDLFGLFSLNHASQCLRECNREARGWWFTCVNLNTSTSEREKDSDALGTNHHDNGTFLGCVEYRTPLRITISAKPTS